MSSSEETAAAALREPAAASSVPAPGPAPPPPAPEAVPAGASAAADDASDALSASLAGARVTTAADDDVDTPAPAGPSTQLVEPEAGEIKTVLAADATPYTSAKTFEDLNLSAELLKGLYKEMGFNKPSRVQAETLPLILTPPFRNLIAQAHNGSGKTTCFVLGMLSRVDPGLPKPQALCLCPTRELVLQNVEVLRKMATHTGITVAHSAGATEKRGASPSATRMAPLSDQVVIATPGTVTGWLTRRTLPARDVKIVVFDEADAMWDDFAPDSLKILRALRDGGAAPQVLLFSATFSDKVRALAEKLVGAGANKVFLPRETLSLDVIKQFRVDCPTPAAKETVLKDMIFPAAEKLGQSIIFVRTRASCARLHAALEAAGHKCTSIRGNMTHEERDAVISEFRGGRTKILIATDVLSRGFDHAAVTLVVNYDPPVDANGAPAFETYMHRIGRSGRFGRKGAAFNLVCGSEERRVLDSIARHFDREVPAVPFSDEEAFERVLREAGLA